MFSFPIPMTERTGRSLSRSILPPFPFSCKGRWRAMYCLFEELLWNLLSLLFWPRWQWRWVNCHCPLMAHSRTTLSLPHVYPQSLVENIACILGDWQISILSPVLFSRWNAFGPTRSPFTTFSLAVYLVTSSVLSFCWAFFVFFQKIKR